MRFYAKNGNVSLPDGNMDYIRFGSGGKCLVILPGLGDGLQSVKGTALPMAWMYRRFAAEYTVYAFSRRNDLPQGSTTRDMARDVLLAMDALGVAWADVLGVSMGGMIAQYLAIDHPRAVGKLVLVATCAESNAIMEESIGVWMSQAQRGDHTALMDSNLRKIYSAEYYRSNKWMIPILGRVTKPKSYDRFLIMAKSCLTHNAAAALENIRSQTLVIGGEQDQALGAEASRELAAKIPGAKLHMYPQWSHGLYEEARDFQQVVLHFLRS